MNSSVTGKGMDVTPQANTKSDSVCGITNFDRFLQPRGQINHGYGTIKHDIYTFAESRFNNLGHKFLLF
jgi:hypothetical protein